MSGLVMDQQSSLPVHTPQGREFISKLKVGDEVEVTYTEAVAISVEPST